MYQVLIADDHPLFRAAIARVIDDGFPGSTLLAASDLDAALAVAGRHDDLDLVLLDLNMPGTSGLVVLPQLLELAPSARLVVLTGYSSIATAVSATQAGASNYLCKPATIEEILAAFEGGTAPGETPVPQDPISVDRLEWEHIQKVLKDNDNNISATARALGMHRRTLQGKLQKRPVKK